MSDGLAVVEAVCGRCRVWWARWSVRLDAPFAENDVELRTNGTVFGVQAPGGYMQATDGAWFPWRPGTASQFPPGEIRARYVFTCPTGCPSNVVAQTDKLEDVVSRVLRELHARRAETTFTITIDKLLRSIP